MVADTFLSIRITADPNRQETARSAENGQLACGLECDGADVDSGKSVPNRIVHSKLPSWRRGDILSLLMRKQLK